MFTVSLIASPLRANLTEETARDLARRWGGGPLRWLQPGVAAEFGVEAKPTDFADVWADLNAQTLDLAIQPTAGRRKTILLADMDSTMIGQECIDELAHVAGVGPRVADITARAMNGELDFNGALTERVSLLTGLPDSVIADVLASRITMASGGAELVATMRAHGGYAALVSGGFTAFTEAVADRLGFDEHRANTLLTDAGRLTGQVGLPILGREAKVEALTGIAAARGVTPADVIAVGDGANDLGMIQRAGTGVALHAKPSVAVQAPIRIDHGDLTALLYLQGYDRTDFVAA